MAEHPLAALKLDLLKREGIFIPKRIPFSQTGHGDVYFFTAKLDHRDEHDIVIEIMHDKLNGPALHIGAVPQDSEPTLLGKSCLFQDDAKDYWQRVIKDDDPQIHATVSTPIEGKADAKLLREVFTMLIPRFKPSGLSGEAQDHWYLAIAALRRWYGL
jgi:hypothetical protein